MPDPDARPASVAILANRLAFGHDTSREVTFETIKPSADVPPALHSLTFGGDATRCGGEPPGCAEHGHGSDSQYTPSPSASLVSAAR